MFRSLVFLFLALAGAKTGAAPAPALIKDVDYVGDGNAHHRLDLLLPENGEGKKLPLVVFIHGGSWISGSRQDGWPVLQGLAQAGYAAATISYRLSDEARWPAQMFDCKAAIRFLRARAADYHIDPDHIGVAGMSAGGHLASMLGTTGGVAELEGSLGADAGTSSRVSCVVNFFGPEDFLTIVAQNEAHPIISKAGQKNVAKLFGAPIEEAPDIARQASPVTWVSKDDAPFLTAHGTADPIVPFAQAREIHTALQKAGVETHLFSMTGKGHGFGSADLNSQVILFLNKHLRNQSAEIPAEVEIADKK